MIDKENMFNKLMPTSGRKTIEDAAPPIANPHIATVTAPPQEPPPPPANNIVMTNIMERLVEEQIDEVFNKFNSCKCERCRQDVAAIALNKVKPKYVIAGEDEIDDIAAKQNAGEVKTALVQAVLVVRAHPRH